MRLTACRWRRAGEVSDQALQRDYYIVTHMLAGRPDILQAMVTNGTRLIIIGKNQLYTDMPEYRHAREPGISSTSESGAPAGSTSTSFGEENLLCLPDGPLRPGKHRGA